MVHRLTCSMACGIFKNQGLKQCLVHCKADSLPLSHPVSSMGWCFCTQVLAFVSLVACGLPPISSKEMEVCLINKSCLKSRTGGNLGSFGMGVESMPAMQMPLTPRGPAVWVRGLPVPFLLLELLPAPTSQGLQTLSFQPFI